MFCVVEIGPYYLTSQGLSFKKGKYRDWKLGTHELNSAQGWLLFGQCRVGPLFTYFFISCHHLKIR